MVSRGFVGKCPLPAGPWCPGWAKLIKVPLRIAITQKMHQGHWCASRLATKLITLSGIVAAVFLETGH